MTVRGSFWKTLLLMVWSAALTSLTLILGASPLLGLRRAAGRLPFWLFGMGLAFLAWGFGQVILAGAFLSLTVLVGVFAEASDSGKSLVVSALLAVLSGWLAAGAGLALWARRFGPDWFGHLSGEVQKALDRFQISATAGGELAFKPEDVVLQGPSAVAIALMLALFLAVMTDRWMRAWMGERAAAVRERLSDFKAPDFMVWVLLAALLGAFLKADLGIWRTVGVNALNVCVVVYFFQGLGVVVRFFEVNKVGLVWRGLWLSLLIVQLFVVVSLLGLVDYWADFRSRIGNKSAPMKKSLYD